MRYLFPIHLNSGNRGCEGIAKGTSILLGQDKSKTIGLCTDIDLDRKFGVDHYVNLQESPKWTLFNKVKRKMILDPEKRKNYNYQHNYNAFLNQANKDDIIISTGGDMMCYDNNQVIYTTNYAYSRGIKNVLWGCSMGAENLTAEKKQTLRLFDLIYARESLTYDFFVSLGLKNVVCYPDPAFVLKPEEVLLPYVFSKGDVLGLNISKFVLGGFDLNTPLGCQITHFIDYILRETNLNILLIPHVTWRGQDDRIVANLLFNRYNNSQRISVLNIDDLNYCQIRYIISKCRFFIGARTHAVISAYSTCVPTIALGYSIKSRGIAKDLNIDNDFVVNSKEIVNLAERLKKLVLNEHNIKKNMEEVMPSYISKLDNLKELVLNGVVCL